MPTPSPARRWLIQAVFVSTRSPRSISVPMVTISALSMFFPSFMLVFYNPPYEGLREHADSAPRRRRPGPLPALGEALRPHPEGGGHRRGTGKGPRPRRGPDAPVRPHTRRRARERTRTVSEARGRVGSSRRRTGTAEPEALARARRCGAGAARTGYRRRRSPGSYQGPHHWEAGDGTARGVALRGGEDGHGRRLAESGGGRKVPLGGPSRGDHRISAAGHR